MITTPTVRDAGPPAARGTGRAAGRTLARAAVRVAVMLAAAVLAIAVAAETAAAAPPDWKDTPGGPSGHGSSSSHISDPCQVAKDTKKSASTFLPVGRWSSAAENLHTAYGKFRIEDLDNRVNKQGTEQIGLAAGSWGWSTGADMLQFANRFCPLDKVGGTVDQQASKLGTAFTHAGFLAVGGIALAVTIGIVCYRGGGDRGAIVRKMVILGLLIAAIAAAGHSTGGGTVHHGHKQTGAYKPATLSPGWYVTSIDKAVSTVASLPVKALSMPKLSGARHGHQPVGCARYTKQLGKQYRAGFDDYTGQTADAVAGPSSAISKLWEQSAVTAYQHIQFGSHNKYAAGTYCRMLDDNAHVSSTVRAHTMKKQLHTSHLPKHFARVRAFHQPGYDRDRVINQTAWAACRLNDDDPDNWNKKTGWHIPGYSKDHPKGAGKLVRYDDAGTGGTNGGGSGPNHHSRNPATRNTDSGEGHDKSGVKHGGGGDDSKQCYKFFNQPPTKGKAHSDDLTIFDWDDADQSDVIDAAGNSPEADYLLTMKGWRSGSLTESGVYAVSGLLILASFGLVALGVIIAKVVALVFMLALLLVGLISLFRSPSTRGDKTVKMLFTYVGLSLYAYGLQLIITVLILITKILQSMAAVIPGGPHGFFGILWTALSPVIAICILHHLFKKTIGVSIFHPSGAMSWGKALAGGAVGAAAVGGIRSAMSRGGQHASNAKRRAGQMSGKFQSSWSKNNAGGEGDPEAGAASRQQTSDVLHQRTPQTGGPDSAGQQLQAEDAADARDGTGAGATVAAGAGAGGGGGRRGPGGGPGAPGGGGRGGGSGGRGGGGRDGGSGQTGHRAAADAPAGGNNMHPQDRKALADQLRREKHGLAAQQSATRDGSRRSQAAGHVRDRAAITGAQMKARPAASVHNGAKWAVRKSVKTAALGAGGMAVMAAGGLPAGLVAAGAYGGYKATRAFGKRRRIRQHARHRDNVAAWHQQADDHRRQVDTAEAEGGISHDEAERLRQHPHTPTARAELGNVGGTEWVRQQRAGQLSNQVAAAKQDSLFDQDGDHNMLDQVQTDHESDPDAGLAELDRVRQEREKARQQQEGTGTGVGSIGAEHDRQQQARATTPDQPDGGQVQQTPTPEPEPEPAGPTASSDTQPGPQPRLGPPPAPSESDTPEPPQPDTPTPDPAPQSETPQPETPQPETSQPDARTSTADTPKTETPKATRQQVDRRRNRGPDRDRSTRGQVNRQRRANRRPPVDDTPDTDSDAGEGGDR